MYILFYYILFISKLKITYNIRTENYLMLAAFCFLFSSFSIRAIFSQVYYLNNILRTKIVDFAASLKKSYFFLPRASEQG